MTLKEVALAIENGLTTIAEVNLDDRPANVVDGLFAIARALESVAKAIEGHGVDMEEAARLARKHGDRS
jgi:hypothetical protein